MEISSIYVVIQGQWIIMFLLLGSHEGLVKQQTCGSCIIILFFQKTLQYLVLGSRADLTEFGV